MRGKHGQAAAIRQEFQTRDAEIAELRHQVRRLTDEKDRLKSQLDSLQRAASHDAAERERELQRRINEAVDQVVAQYGVADAVKDAKLDAETVAPSLYKLHLINEHGMDDDVAWDQVVAEIKQVGTRANRRATERRMNGAAGRSAKDALAFAVTTL